MQRKKLAKQRDFLWGEKTRKFSFFKMQLFEGGLLSLLTFEIKYLFVRVQGRMKYKELSNAIRDEMCLNR